MSSSSRRRFLQQCALGSAALGLSSVSAIEPIQRNGAPKFKFSLAAYSYRNLFKSGEAKLSDFIADCARMGLEGTELTSYYFPEKVTGEYLRSLKQQCFRLGLDVSGTAVRNDFCNEDPAKLKQDIEHVKRWADYAEILSAPVIRIFAGKVKGDPRQAHKRMVRCMEECCEYAGKRGVHLALENHGGPTSTAEGLLKLVKDVQSPWFGVNLDTGNFHTEDIYGDLEKVAPYALNVQIKVVVSGPERKNPRPADFTKLAKILRDVHYRGYVVLEYEENGDPRQESAKYIEQLRTAFA